MNVRFRATRLPLALILLSACGGGADGGGTAPVAVSAILVAPDTAYVRRGQSQQLEASARADDGTVLPSARLVWASTDTAVATVSAGGLVTARGYGATSVTASADGVVGRAAVRVTGEPGLVVLSGEGVADTATATVAQPLVVELRDTRGLPVSGVPLAATVSVAPTPGCVPSPGWTCAAPQLTLGAVTGSVTDAGGRVAFQVAFRQIAGPAAVVVSAPTLGFADTARYTVRPGAASRVALLPKDTALFAGARYALRVSVTDRHGNLRADTAQLRVAGSAATLDGTSVRGAAFGPATVIATLGARADTASVGVVPQGTIAAYSAPDHTGQAAAIYTLNLDGSDFRQIRQTVVGPGYFGNMPVDWLSPTALVYHDNNWDHTKQLYVHDLATGVARRFLPTDARMEMENFPRVSHDRQWVYFGGGSYSSYWVHRARADGSGKERVSLASAPAPQWAPAPAPDGVRVAYVAQGEYSAGTLEVIDLATRQVQKLNVGGTMPRWSPDGTQIAYVSQSGSYSSSSGDLSVVKPDGTGARAATNGTSKYFGGVDWSPDGRYLVGMTTGGKLAIVEVASGTEVLVSFPQIGRTLNSPVWKP